MQRSRLRGFPRVRGKRTLTSHAPVGDCFYLFRFIASSTAASLARVPKLATLSNRELRLHQVVARTSAHISQRNISS